MKLEGIWIIGSSQVEMYFIWILYKCKLTLFESCINVSFNHLHNAFEVTPINLMGLENGQSP